MLCPYFPRAFEFGHKISLAARFGVTLDKGWAGWCPSQGGDPYPTVMMCVLVAGSLVGVWIVLIPVRPTPHFVPNRIPAMTRP